MSHIIATVSKINNCNSLHIVEFEFHEYTLIMVSLDISDKIKIGTKIKLIIKPFHIAIAKNFNGNISYSNQLDTTIKSIENGKLLSTIKLNFVDTIVESIITLKASQKMNLKEGDHVTAFIKASEVAISEIIYD